MGYEVARAASSEDSPGLSSRVCLGDEDGAGLHSCEEKKNCQPAASV